MPKIQSMCTVQSLPGAFATLTKTIHIFEMYKIYSNSVHHYKNLLTVHYIYAGNKEHKSKKADLGREVLEKNNLT